MATSTYLVRDARTHRLVGLICARRSNDLYTLIDDRTDPFDCEYLELRPGERLFVDELLAAGHGGRDQVVPASGVAGTDCAHETAASAEACVAAGTHTGAGPRWRSLGLDGFQYQAVPSLS